MALNWQTPAGGNFADTFYNFLKVMEGPANGDLLNPLLVGGNPTIGVGFDLVAGGAAVQREVLRHMGFEYVDIDRTQRPPVGTPEAIEYGYLQQLRAQMVNGGSIATMNQVMAARASNTNPQYVAYAQNRRTSFAFANEAEVRAAYDVLLPIYENKVTSVYPMLAGDVGYATSREKMVLTDLAWNGGTGVLGEGLKSAIVAGKRAEAWYEIRYNTNKLGWARINGTATGNQLTEIAQHIDEGLAKRRYFEAEVLGLYSGTADTAQQLNEAKAAYRMLQLHREKVLQYESQYGVKPDGVSGVRNMIAEANASYTAMQTHTLVESFEYAEVLILDDLAASTDPSLKAAYDGWKSNRADFISTDLYLGSGFSGTLDSTKNESSAGSNDVLLVDSTTPVRNWTIKGGKGNDLLIGGKGNDNLYGGEGSDYLAGGKGNDKYYVTTGETVLIEDKDGINTIYLDDKVLATFYRVAGTSMDYISYDGSLTGQLVNGEFKVWDNNGTTITLNADFQEGDFGITFKDKPTDPAITNTITGDISPDDTDPYTEGIQATSDVHGSLIGTAQPYADILAGTYGNDHIVTGELNDTVEGGEGDDWIEGGNGNDYLTGTRSKNGTLRVYGGGNDLIEGGEGTDIIDGDTGDDRLYGNLKIETADAIEQGGTDVGTGNKGDWLAGGNGDDLLVAGADNDLLSGGAGSDLIIGGAGDDYLWGNGGDDSIQGGDGFDALDGGAGNDLIEGGAGADAADFAEFPGFPNLAEILEGGEGDDRIFAGTQADMATIFDASVQATAERNFMSGYNGRDTLIGSAGNDDATGGADEDLIATGAGDDKIYGDADSSYTATTTQLSATIESINPGGKADLIYAGSGNDWARGDLGNDTIFGQEGNDTIFGDASELALAQHGDDYLNGGSGDDVIYGQGGSDRLLGEAGIDELVGDEGDDWLDGGTENDTLYGLTGNDELYAGDGDDYIEGGLGLDVIYGGIGKDTIYGDDATDTVNGDNDVISAGEGDDFVQGGAGNDLIAGEGGIDQLLGGAGNDTISGEAGNDQLLGEAGDDSLSGGDNDDVLQAGDGNDTLEGGAGNDTLLGEAGNDQLNGGDGADQLQGNDGDDLVVGGIGNDNMWGDAGDDTFVFNLGDGGDALEDTAGQDRIRFGAGITASDLVIDSFWGGGAQYLYIGYSATDSVSIKGGFLGSIELYEFADGTTLTHAELLQNAPALYLEGTNQSEVIQGGGRNDRIIGFAGNDTLIGGGGDDSLFGGAGNDLLIGGPGYNELFGDIGSDTYSFTRGEGGMVYEKLGITTAADTDVLLFDSSIAPADVTITRNSADLVLNAGKAANDLEWREAA